MNASIWTCRNKLRIPSNAIHHAAHSAPSELLDFIEGLLVGFFFVLGDYNIHVLDGDAIKMDSGVFMASKAAWTCSRWYLVWLILVQYVRSCLYLRADSILYDLTWKASLISPLSFPMSIYSLLTFSILQEHLCRVRTVPSRCLMNPVGFQQVLGIFPVI